MLCFCAGVRHYWSSAACEGKDGSTPAGRVAASARRASARIRHAAATAGLLPGAAAAPGRGMSRNSAAPVGNRTKHTLMLLWVLTFCGYQPLIVQRRVLALL